MSIMTTMNMTIDHQQAIKARILEQYKDRPNLLALLQGLNNQVQKLEDDMSELWDKRSLLLAVGVQLDHLGAIVGEARNSRCDEVYRKAIYARIMINNGGGTPEDIITAINLLFAPDLVDLREYSGWFQAYVQGKQAPLGLKSIIKSIRPAGISDCIITHYQSDNPFIFSECSTEDFELNITDLDTGTSLLSIQDQERELNTTLSVTGDSYLLLGQGSGFSEIVANEGYLDIGDNFVYAISQNTPLILVEDLDDFEIVGGGSFGEVIEEDDENN